jgi:hypothetical protein
VGSPGTSAVIGALVAVRYWTQGTATVEQKIAPASDLASAASSKTSWTFDELRRYLESARSQLGSLGVTLLWTTTDDLDLEIATVCKLGNAKPLPELAFG